MIQWTSVPFRLGGKRNIIAIAIPLLVWGIVYIFWGPGWFLISFLLIGGSILPYFLPTHYTLSEDGIVVRSLFTRQKKRWNDYKSFSVDKNGIFLSPFAKPSRLENYRGMYIRFHKNREDVIEFVKLKMDTKE
jgi:hypothetical protein